MSAAVQLHGEGVEHGSGWKWEQNKRQAELRMIVKTYSIHDRSQQYPVDLEPASALWPHSAFLAAGAPKYG